MRRGALPGRRRRWGCWRDSYGAIARKVFVYTQRERIIVSYAFDLRQVCGGYAYFSTFTSGHLSKSANYEIRRPSQVDADRTLIALEEIGQRARSVDSMDAYETWLYTQGWAIVDAEFARTSLQQWLKQHECIKSSLGSFTDISISSPTVMGRSLSGKAKQQIHERDGNHCLLCKSDTAPLTLQHVWPFSAGGETSSRNLVTLCEKCNQALKTEIHVDLYRLAGLTSGFEGALLKSSDLSAQAMSRAIYFSANLMHTRCIVW
jgi:hypothetical protein